MKPDIQPPYYAVIFTSTLSNQTEGYAETNHRISALAQQQPGYLCDESYREGKKGVTISYWRDLDAIQQWKQQAEHLIAQQHGRDLWYESYQVKISRVERAYTFPTKT